MASPRTPKSTAHSRYNRLRELKCFAELEKQLKDGYPISELARWVQEEKREFNEFSKGTLITLLSEYRKLIPAAEFPKNPAFPILNRKQDVVEDFDVLTELKRLYGIQRERIQFFFESEKKIKLPIGQLGNEVRIAKELLGEYAEKSMDMGLVKRQIGQVDIDAKVVADVTKTYANTLISTAMESALSRQKIMSVSDKVLKLLNSGAEISDKMFEDEETIEVNEVSPEPTPDKEKN